MNQNNLSENQKKFLIEIYKRWGTSSSLLDDSWKVQIDQAEVDSLVKQRYLVDVKREGGKIKFNLSIKGQEFAKAYLNDRNHGKHRVPGTHTIHYNS